MTTFIHKTNRITALAAASMIILAGTQGSQVQAAPPDNVPAANVPISIVSRTPVLEPATITIKKVTARDDTYQADLNLPVISGMLDTQAQEEWNTLIEANATKELEVLKATAAENKKNATAQGFPFHASELTKTFDVTSNGVAGTGGILSLHITTYTFSGGANGFTRIDTYNIKNEATATRVTLKTLFGDKYQKIINTQISAAMAKDAANYFAEDFKGVNEESSFYIKGSSIYVIFQQNEIAPHSTGNPEFKIALPTNSTAGDLSSMGLVVNGKALSGVKLSLNDSGVVLAPIRAISEALGYELAWNKETSSLELNMGAHWTLVTKNKDSYIYNRMAPITLGTAPVINHEGSMYVPMSFFTEILKASVQYESGRVSISSES
ncbi:stalk domain-containing protein [Paenibacillus monticola]|uniref:DUF4163 domain-containing protein n=1 Tax=Paenibacillus monticola TaxID=2666075 RepID=A0A7X2L4F9_9BACL|nr:stalk domain-containing protein [Paenibacillus monticola]MRN56273.1 DUF4163 domain-containing protein [Paenibacillus monticola]